MKYVLDTTTDNGIALTSAGSIKSGIVIYSKNRDQITDVTFTGYIHGYMM